MEKLSFSQNIQNAVKAEPREKFTSNGKQGKQ